MNNNNACLDGILNRCCIKEGNTPRSVFYCYQYRGGGDNVVVYGNGRLNRHHCILVGKLNFKFIKLLIVDYYTKVTKIIISKLTNNERCNFEIKLFKMYFY